MKRSAMLAGIFALILPLILLPANAAGEQIYFEADFDDKPVDAPIEAGGPELGEPVFVDPMVIAMVRGAPLPTPCLELQDNDDYAAGSVRFEFLDRVEITSGIVAVYCALWFPELAPGYRFHLYVREQGSSAASFANLTFTEEGNVWLDDEAGGSDLSEVFEVQTPLAVTLVFDMDQGLYDVWLDRSLVVDDRAHGIDDRGVGSVLLGCDHDSDLDGRFFVDDILVTDTFTPMPVIGGTWGTIKALFR